MSDYSYIAWIPLLPLAGFVILGLFGRKRLGSFSGLLGTALILAAAVLSLFAAWQYFFVNGPTGGVYRTVIPFRFTWLSFSQGLSIDMSILLDPISVMMIVVVSLVSLMVHIFSLGYMRGEERFGTYYAFLSLFSFSMLGLVLSGNIFQLFIFWELVGCSSFLLIGYYYDRPSAVAACKKAFIVTRFADLGFLIGILILSFYGGSLDFGTLIQRLTSPSPQLLNITASSFLGFSVLSWSLTLIFVGGAGKSAMFPLHVWLPDAMEGPTPVSALIHAATMVVAGVYLVARLFPIFAHSDPQALGIVAWVGAFSALIAAVMACTQTDIKRVLAYSTMSQIGYMMFALGVSGYGGESGLGFMASMFHLFTHAWFKALLFLCAGVIIHKVHSNEMGDMGGLRRVLPLTHICFLVACLAISGIPPFSGFFSKEEILTAALHDRPIYWIGLITAGLTAFYMFRLYFSVFWKRESDHQVHSHSHSHGHGHGHGHSEGPFSMKLPLVLLAFGAMLAGLIPFGRFVSSDGAALETHPALASSIAPIVLALLGIALAWGLYKKANDRPARIAAALGALYKLAYRKFYIDEIYLFVTRKIIFSLIGRPAAWIDRHIVDGMMNGLARLTAWVSSLIKGLQSGKMQDYALYFFTGIAGLAILFIYIYRS